jgi:two-component system response regulator AtoC
MKEHVNDDVSQGIPPLEVIFGCSSKMSHLHRIVERVASAPIPVLLTGESGTGKGVIARVIHQLSPIPNSSFVRVTCPAIPGSLLETELFGYEELSFTGATRSKQGRVEMAHQGTLFLDEISDLELGLQAKLLQLLQDGQFCRIGANEGSSVELRLICSTNRPIEQQIRDGRFRADLYFRINGVTIELPPLRERVCDIPVLVDFFIRNLATKYGVPARRFSNESLARLKLHLWPGNIRELEHMVRRYLIVADEDAVLNELALNSKTTLDLGISLGGQESLKDITRKAVHQLEKEMISNALQANGGNRKKAAKALNISYRGVLHKLRECGLGPKRSTANARVDEPADSQRNPVRRS